MYSRPAIAGTAIIYSIQPDAHTRVGLLIAFYCTQFILAEGNLLFSLISRNVAGQTKKSTVLAITFVAWAAGNATAPQVVYPFSGIIKLANCHTLVDFSSLRCTSIPQRLHRTLLPICSFQHLPAGIQIHCCFTQ